MISKPHALKAVALCALLASPTLGNNLFVLPTFTGNATASATVYSGNPLAPAATFSTASDAFLVLARPTANAADTKYYVISRSGSNSLIILNSGLTPVGTPLSFGFDVAADMVKKITVAAEQQILLIDTSFMEDLHPFKLKLAAGGAGISAWAGMGDLNGGRHTIGAVEVGNCLQPGDLAVFPNAGATMGDAPSGGHRRGLDEGHAEAAKRKARVMSLMPGLHIALDGLVLAHG